VWSASESEDFFANDDLVMRWSEDGENWSPVIKVSPVIRNGMNDWPALIIYQEKLYIFWKTMDDNIADVTSENDMDIVYRWWDGTNFGPIKEITKGDDGAIDWSYDLAIYNNRIYIVWETDTSSDPLGVSFQVDIMVKSFDGNSWSNRKNLCPSGDKPEDKDEIPRAYVWYNPVRKMEELYVIWGRGNGQADGSGDINIVIRVFDGLKWSPRQEISKPDVTVQNMGHQLIGYKGRLYAIWIDGKESMVVGMDKGLIVFKIFGDIVIRSYDGYEWSSIKELTPSGLTDKASDPELCVFNGKLYASWSYPNDQTPSGDDWDIILRNIDFQDVTLDVDIGDDGTFDWSGELQSSQQVIPLNRSQIEDAMVGGSITDDNGNEITEVTIRIKSRFPAKIRAHELKIEYEYKIPFEFTDQLNDVLEFNRPMNDESRQGDNITTHFPFKAGSETSGKIVFEDLEVDYMVNYAPFLIREIPIVYMDEDTDLLDAIDLEEYFDDDWDDGRLRFSVESVEDPNLLDARLNGSWIGFITPTENWYGVSNVTVVAKDGFGLASFPHVITIRVLPVNDAPILDFIPDQEVRIGERFKYQATAFDVDGDKLMFADTTNKFKINEETGVISFIPSHRGVFKVNISVADGFGGEDYQNVTFTVVGESTSSTETSCFTLAAIVLLCVAIGLVAWKLRHEFKWGPIGPERLKVKTEEEEAEEVEAAPVKGKGKRKGPPRKKGRPKKKAVVPGTDVAYEKFDLNKDGFIDEKEWALAVHEIKKQKALKAMKRRARLKAKAKRMAKKKIEMEKKAKARPKKRPRSRSRPKRQAPPPEPDISDPYGAPPPPPRMEVPPPPPVTGETFKKEDEYVPPGLRKYSLDEEEGWKKSPLTKRTKKKK
jgi:hypothetical protein